MYTKMLSRGEIKLRQECYSSLYTIFNTNPAASSMLLLKALDAAAPDYKLSKAMEAALESIECIEASAGEASIELFASEGMLEVSQALSTNSAATLNAYVNEQFCKHIQEHLTTFADIDDHSEVELRSYGERRHLFKLQLFDQPVIAALQEALPKLEPVLRASVGPDSVLIECSALIVDPGSPNQALHADTLWMTRPEVVAVFIALQDISLDMGPTQMLPKTHTDPAYWQKAIEEGDPERCVSDPEYLQNTLGTPPLHECKISSGTAMVMDTRLLHRGSANRSSKRRTLFYLTFARPDCAKDIPEVPEGTDLDANVSLRRVANSLSYQKIAQDLKSEYGDLVTLQGLTERLASGALMR